MEGRWREGRGGEADAITIACFGNTPPTFPVAQGTRERGGKGGERQVTRKSRRENQQKTYGTPGLFVSVVPCQKMSLVSLFCGKWLSDLNKEKKLFSFPPLRWLWPGKTSSLLVVVALISSLAAAADGHCWSALLHCQGGRRHPLSHDRNHGAGIAKLFYKKI